MFRKERFICQDIAHVIVSTIDVIVTIDVVVIIDVDREDVTSQAL